MIGVDRALYMKSTSANDGSYTLTVSFALGTNPDINTVNVNNRVQSALSQLPTEVQQQGVTVQKRSSSILQFLVLYRCRRPAGPALHHQLRHHQRARRDCEHAESQPGKSVRQDELLDADLVRHPAAHQPQSGASRRHRCDPRPERRRPLSAASARGRSAISSNSSSMSRRMGRLATTDQFANIVLRSDPDGSCYSDQGRRPRRDGRAESRQRSAHRRACRRASCDLPRAGCPTR